MVQGSSQRVTLDNAQQEVHRMGKLTIEVDTDDQYITDDFNLLLNELEQKGLISDWRYCTSDDPQNHQGNTCPIHDIPIATGSI